MSWESFELQRADVCRIVEFHTNRVITAQYSLELIYTGRQKVFWGRRIFVNSDEVSLEARDKGDSGSFQRSLRVCNDLAREKNFVLLVAGNVSDYHETGLSCSSGYGYIRENGKLIGVGIMDDYQLPQVRLNEIMERGFKG